MFKNIENCTIEELKLLVIDITKIIKAREEAQRSQQMEAVETNQRRNQ